jgi:peroxiredoxin
MDHLKDFQKRVVKNASQGLRVVRGDLAPDFSLPNAFGQTICLSKILETDIVILKFYRGEWCPICNLDLREIQKHLPEIKSYGATLLAISPQKPDDALTISQRNELGFDVLSDEKQEVIKSYHLQFDPGEDYHKRRDLTLLNGDGSKTLPVPATFIIDTNQKIIAGHVEADYTLRMNPKEILLVLSEINKNE